MPFVRIKRVYKFSKSQKKFVPVKGIYKWKKEGKK